MGLERTTISPALPRWAVTRCRWSTDGSESKALTASARPTCLAFVDSRQEKLCSEARQASQGVCVSPQCQAWEGDAGVLPARASHGGRPIQSTIATMHLAYGSPRDSRRCWLRCLMQRTRRDPHRVQLSLGAGLYASACHAYLW